jgi:hypothetical protein
MDILHSTKSLEPTLDLVWRTIFDRQVLQEDLAVPLSWSNFGPLRHRKIINEECLTNGAFWLLSSGPKQLAQYRAFFDELAITNLGVVQLLHSLLHVIRALQLDICSTTTLTRAFEKPDRGHATEEGENKSDLLLGPARWEAPNTDARRGGGLLFCCIRTIRCSFIGLF